jgi:replicative DNA helicase
VDNIHLFDGQTWNSRMTSMPTMERIPPHSEAAELAVIGTAIVASTEVLQELADLFPDAFFLPHHRTAWELVCAIRDRGGRVDLVSIQDEARAQAVASRMPDGLGWFLSAAQAATAPELAVVYAGTVKKMATLRALIGLCAEVSARAYSMPEVDSALGDLRRGLEGLEASGANDGANRICDLIDEVTAAIEDRARNPEKQRLARIGLAEVDELIGDQRRGHLVMVGGLPGMGKSSFARQVLAHNVINGIPGCVWTNEMDRAEWIEALISLRSHIPACDLARGKLEYSQWRNKVLPSSKQISEYPLWVDDRTLTASATCGEARRWFSKHVKRQGKDYGLIVIDYLNLVISDEKSENRNQEVTKILASFKRLAKDLRTTVMVVAQLNRKSSNENREPVMSDFRDSGMIEAMSDVIICPYRDGYGKPTTVKLVPFQPQPARILVLKRKGGATGGVDVEWHRERMEFTDIEGRQPQDQPHWQAKGNE